MPISIAQLRSLTVEYLAHRALADHGATDLEIVFRDSNPVPNTETDHTEPIQIKFNAPATQPIPIPEPPERFRMHGWSDAHSSYHEGDPDHPPHHLWKTPATIHPERVEDLRELMERLRFFPQAIALTPFDTTTGGADPMTDQSTGQSLQIDDQTTLLLVHHDPVIPRNDTGPNVIFPNGVARHSPQLRHHSKHNLHIARLEPAETRARAELLTVEARVIITKPQSRTRLNTPLTPGISADTVAKLASHDETLYQRFLEQLLDSDAIIEPTQNQYQPQTSGKIYHFGIHTAYASSQPTAASHPVHMDDRNKRTDINRSIAHAVVLNTRFTPVDHYDSEDLPVVNVQRITAVINTEDSTQEVTLYRRDNPNHDHAAAATAPVVLVESIQAAVNVRFPDDSVEHIVMAVPLLLVIKVNLENHSIPTLYISKTAGQRLSQEQIQCMVSEAGRNSLGVNQVKSIAIEATKGQPDAFRHELTQILDRFRPAAGLPIETVYVEFNSQGWSYSS